MTAAAILATSPETLRAAGLSGAKTRSLLDLAAKVSDGTRAARRTSNASTTTRSSSG